MAFGRCAWCDTEVQFSLHFGGNNSPVTPAEGHQRFFSFMSCPRCGGPRVLEHTAPNSGINHITLEIPDRTDARFVVRHLPDDVSGYYEDAVALRIAYPDSAAVQLRRTLEAATGHFDVEGKTLFNKIAALEKKGLITNQFSKAVTHIRQVGNLGAHASDERVDAAVAERALLFTTQFLRNLFEVPAELAALNQPD